MAVVRQTSREWWSIVEGKLRPALGKLQASAKGIDLPPKSYDLFLFSGEIKLCGDLCVFSQ